MNLNNSGVGDQDESAANLGGDFFAAWGFDLSGIHPWRRYFPLEEISEIFALYRDAAHPHGFNFSVLALKECETLFDLGTWAEVI